MGPRLHSSRLAFAAALLAASLAGCATAQQPPAAPSAELPAVPYVPTPQPVVEKMLDMARVGRNDVVYDLGCGDGRIVITAARERGARGVGIDIDPVRIAEANAKRREAKVEDKVRFLVGDLFKSDFSEATVVMLYLLPDVNVALRPQLWRQLKVGTRVVSHDYHMGEEWPPEQVEHVAGKVLYLWTIGEAQKRAAATGTAPKP